MKIQKLFAVAILVFLLSACGYNDSFSTVTVTPIPSNTRTATITVTPSPSATPSVTPSPSATPSVTPSPTPTATPISFSDAAEQGLIENIQSFGYGDLWSAVYSPKGDKVAFATTIGVYIFDADNFNGIVFMPTENAITSLAFISDGKLLAGGGLNGEITIWDVEKWDQVAKLVEHESAILSLAFSPDSQFLASSAEDKVVIWQTNDWSLNETLYFPYARKLVFTPDGNYLFVSRGAILLRVPDWVITNKLGGLVSYNGKMYGVSSSSIAISPNSNFLAIGYSRQSFLGIWEYPSMKLHLMLQIDPENDRGTFAHSINAMEFSNSGEHLVFSGDKLTGVIDVADGSLLNYSTEGGKIVSYSPSSDAVLLGEVVRDSMSWNILEQSYLPAVGNKDNIFKEDPWHASPSGKWEYEIEQETGNISLHEEGGNTIINYDQAHRPGVGLGGGTSSVTAISFSHDESFFVSGGVDQQVKLWKISEELSPLPLGRVYGMVSNIVISPDDTLIAAYDWNGNITVWSIANNTVELLFSASVQPYERSRMAFSPDGKVLAASDGAQIKIFRVDGGILLETLNNIMNVNALQFSDDSTMLFSKGRNIVNWWGAEY